MMTRWILLALTLTLVPDVQPGEARPSGANPVQALGTRGSPSLAVDPDFSAVDRHLDAVYRSTPGRADGLAVLVADRSGALVYSREAGTFTAERVVPLASATKLLSAATIMTVVDEGLLELDAPISRYLDGVPEDKSAITLRQLLSHTSGLHGPGYGERAMNRQRGSLSEVTEEIMALPLAAPPGRVFGYGEASLQVAGAMAEVVTGLDWHTLFAERITLPLAMASTTYGTGLPFLGSSVQSSANEYLVFLRMLQDGGTHEGRRVLSEEAVKELLTEQTGGADLSGSPYAPFVMMLGQGFRMSYALGNWVERVDEEGRAIDNASAGLFGFIPWIDRQNGTVGVFAHFGNMMEIALPYFEMKRLVREALTS